MGNKFCKKELWECSADLASVAMGRKPAETVIKNAKLINVCTAEIIEHTDVAIYSGRIALVGDALHCIGEGTKIIDAEGEYRLLAESLGGINVVISPTSKTIINVFDIETEVVKDEITGRDRTVLNVENKVEDVTQALLTMAKGSTRSSEVNELTKQIIAESVAEEYASRGINSISKHLSILIMLNENFPDKIH